MTSLNKTTRHGLIAIAVLLVALAATGSPASAQTGIQFDGSNDYVTFGLAAPVGVSTFTLEIWFYKEGSGATASTGTGGVIAVPLLTKGRGEADGNNKDMNFFLGIRGSDNVLVADFEEGTGQTSPGLNHPVVGKTPIRENLRGRHRVDVVARRRRGLEGYSRTTHRREQWPCRVAARRRPVSRARHAPVHRQEHRCGHHVPLHIDRDDPRR